MKMFFFANRRRKSEWLKNFCLGILSTQNTQDELDESILWQLYFRPLTPDQTLHEFHYHNPLIEVSERPKTRLLTGKK